MYTRILVPVDASPLANRAMDTAFRLAVFWNASVTVLFARHDPGDQDPAEVDADMAEVARQTTLLERTVAERLAGHELPASRVSTQVRSGNPRGAIIAAAEELEIDLIVMGSHGRHGLVDALLGSTTEQVVRDAKASVLVVRSPLFGVDTSEDD